MEKLSKKVLKKFRDPKWRKKIAWNLAGIAVIIVFLWIVDSVLAYFDIFNDRTVPTGLLLGSFIILWGLYFLFTYIKSKIGNLTKAGAILWMKSIAEVAEFANKFGALIGYPAIEIARTNNKITVGAVEVLREALQNLSDFARRLAIFGSIVLVAIMIPIYFPISNLGMVIIVALILISFTVMGVTEPIVKPLEGKNIRRVIRPISLALPLIGIIFLFNAHGRPFVDGYTNIFFGYIVVLVIMSFKSYHGMYTSNAARHWLWYTVIALIISLGLQKINFWDSEYWLWAKNQSNDLTQTVRNENADANLNIHSLTDTTVIFVSLSYQPAAAVDNQGNILILMPGDEVSKLDSPLIYLGSEPFATIRTKNEFGLFMNGPVYVPNRFLKEKDLVPIAQNQISHNNETQLVDDNIQYINHQYPVGTRYKLFSESGENFYYKTSSNKWIIIQSGQLIEVDNEPPNICQVKPKVPNDNIWMEVQ